MSEQKPDQWQKRHPVRTMGKWENTHEHDAKWWRDNSSGWEIRALYAAPPAQPAPRKMDIPPAPIDALSVAYAEGWNAACDAFFGGLPPLEPLVVTVTQPAQAQPARLSDERIDEIAASAPIGVALDGEEINSYIMSPDGLHALAHAIAAAVVPPGFVVVKDWQPIETAPKDGATVIVGRDMGDFGFIRGYARWEGEGHVAGWISCGFDPISSNLGLAHPTHWMPLPSAPKATK